MFMSRSFKKNAVVKDNQSFFKKLGNKIIRRKVKSAIKHEDEIFPKKNEGVDKWDISDWRYRPSKKEDPEDYKKSKRK